MIKSTNAILAIFGTKIQTFGNKTNYILRLFLLVFKHCVMAQSPWRFPLPWSSDQKNGRIFCAALRETSLGVTLVSAQYHQNVAVSSCFYIKSASSWLLLGENLGSMAFFFFFFPFCSINLALVDTDARDVFLPAKRNEGWHQTVMWQSEHMTIFLPEDGASFCRQYVVLEEPPRYRVKYSSRKISFRSFSLAPLWKYFLR